MRKDPTTKQIAGYIVGSIVVCLIITWLIQGSDFFMFKIFAPKYEAVRRETFEQSRAFNQGMVQELENMEFDYKKEKDPKAQQALGSIILHRCSGYNLQDPSVPQDLREFINGLKQ